MGVLGHFLVLVVGRREAQLGGQVGEFALEGLAHARGVSLRQLTEAQEAGGALNQKADGGLVPCAENQVAVVVVGNQVVFQIGRALIDQHQVLQLTPGGGHAPWRGLSVR